MQNKGYLTHSSVQHSFHLAYALQQGGLLKKYITSFYYKRNQRFYSFLRSFRKLDKFLLKRNFQALCEDKIQIVPYLEIVEQLTRIIFGNSQRTLDVSYWKDRAFSAHVSRFELKQPFDFVIGYPNCSLEIFKKAKQYGAITILDLPTLHHRSIFEIIENEKKLVPEFSNSMATMESRHFERLDEEIEFADFIVVPSNFVLNDLISIGIPQHKIFKIPYGSNILPANEFEIATYDAAHPLKIVFVGQIQQKKGIKYLLEAVKELKDQKYNIELSLVGKIYDCEDQLVQYRDVFTHVPFMDRDSLKKFLLTQHIFCLPSLIEGSSLACVEAAACGLVCLVSENTGAEVVSDSNGAVFKIRDSRAIADEISKMYLNPEICNMKKIESLKNVSNLSWQNYYDEWIKVLKTLSK